MEASQRMETNDPGFDPTNEAGIPETGVPDGMDHSATSTEAAMASSDDPRRGLSGEAIRIFAETVGISNLNDEAAKELAEELTFR